MLKFRRLACSLVLASTLCASPLTAAEEEKQTMAEFLSDYGNNVLPLPWLSKEESERETLEERQIRVSMIAEVTAEQAPISAEELGWYWDSKDLAYAAFVKMWYESGRFRLMVHTGEVKGDSGKSVCLGQIWGGKKDLVGTDRDSTRRCAAEVMKHLAFHQKRCLRESSEPSQYTMSKVFAGYGTGWSCRENIWAPVRDTKGKIVLDDNGQPVKDFWARKRGMTWWKVRHLSPELL